MIRMIDSSTLHRTAKYFMDSGRAATPEDAMALLSTFGLTVIVGDEVNCSAAHQIALLSLINTARRTFLAGVEVLGVGEARDLSGLSNGLSLADAIRNFGATVTQASAGRWPVAIIGSATSTAEGVPAWQLTWEGWRGGVAPAKDKTRLREDAHMRLAPALAAAMCCAEVFAYHAGDHPMAGRRDLGLSLWNPSARWLEADAAEPVVRYLPADLWLIGLGNLGQAFAWSLACLPYSDKKPCFTLQDIDDVSTANVSTSLLTTTSSVGRRKTRMVAEWLEDRGFRTVIEERRFGSWSRRGDGDPQVVLCGVDNSLARASLEDAGYGLILEAGLGAGPDGFRSIVMHTFPASRNARDVWAHGTAARHQYDQQPAYQSLLKQGRDKCGVVQMASRTVAVPFVALTASAVVLAELLRRLHRGRPLELVSVSMLSVSDVEYVEGSKSTYDWGYCDAAAPSPTTFVTAEAAPVA